mmetsp:Transcript_27241/g.53566  ORF Transcript_27241/g.53566 Transcript_27241/m.53566 type:complete len:368 (-) Transcript_27241:121-1224(-)
MSESKNAGAEPEIPMSDISEFLKDGKMSETCTTIAQNFHEYGLIIVKDPRVDPAENEKFIDMMEKYFGQPEGLKLKDVRKEFHYQVGATPNNTEKARDHCSKFDALGENDKPITECPPGADPKWRFFWRMGELPKETEFKQLNADPVYPEAFPEWPKTMNTWGSLILDTVSTVSEMAALGFGLPQDSFTTRMKCGPHLLAPTGSDLQKHGAKGTVFASYHYDLNFMTIHGRSRYPGLFVWTRSGKKVRVKVPPGCLLIQAGAQFEYLTGGHVLAGYHEVVVADATLAAIEKAKAEKRSLWRVSSTLFSHIASDNILEPIGKFSTPEALKKYPPTKAGHQVQKELDHIKLGVSDSAEQPAKKQKTDQE